MKDLPNPILHSRIIGDKTPLVILHGFLGSGDNWKSLGNKFAIAGFQVHLIDQRNHGRSFWSEDFCYQLLVDDLKKYCQANQLTEINLLGHSMGGKAAMLFAVTYPEMVKKLIVADIGPKFYPEHHNTILGALSRLNFQELKSRSAADESLAEEINDAGVRQFLLKNVYWIQKGKLGLRVNLKVLIGKIEAIGVALPAATIYEKATLFLKGSNSSYILESDEALIKKHFPNAKIKNIVNAGHWLHAENPSDFYSCVIAFL